MSRFQQFEAALREINKLREFESSADELAGYEFVGPLIAARIAALMAAFDEPAPVPVEPVKPKAKRGDVDGAVKEQLVALAENGSGPEHIDWQVWAHERKLNRKSVLAAVRRHEKNKT